MPSFLRASVWLLSALGMLLFVWVASARLVFPLPLHPVESAVLEQVARLAGNAPMYAAPSISYVPLPMMPGYPVLAAVLARAFDPGLWQLRLIAMLAGLIVAALTIWAVRFETRSWTIAVAGAGALLLAFGNVTGAVDLGRPEPLALVFILAGFVQLRVSERHIGTLIAAALFACGFFTQLEMGWFVLAACLHLAFENRRRLALFGPAVLVICGGAYAMLANQWSPWFSYYTWDVPFHALALSMGPTATAMRDLMLRAFAPLTVVALLCFAMPKRPWKGPQGLWMWFVAGGLAFGITASAEPWNDHHAWLPLAAALAVFGPCAIGKVVQHLATWPGSNRLAGQNVVVAILALQLVTLLHGPDAQMPPAGVQTQWDHYRAWLRSHGNVLAPGNAYVARAINAHPAYDAFALDQLAASPGNRLMAEDPGFLTSLTVPLMSGDQRPMLLTDRPLSECGPLLATLDSSYEMVRTPADVLVWRDGNDGWGLPTYLYRPIRRHTAADDVPRFEAPDEAEVGAAAGIAEGGS